ncbi:MAG TPA: kelch repeat-containing protein, partial [Nitrospirota bacterium]|nr:kelch repeat-containing protein [Nitrospirota bacterium]
MDKIAKRQVIVIGKYSAWIVLPLLAFLALPAIMAPAEEGPWEVKKPAPVERSEVAAAALDNRVYVIGGFLREGIGDLVEEYDPAEDRWTERAP